MRGPPVSIETIISMPHKARSNIPGYSTSRHPEQVLFSHISTKANLEVPITCGILFTYLDYTHPSMTIIHVSQRHHHLGMSSITQDCTKEYIGNVTTQGSTTPNHHARSPSNSIVLHQKHAHPTHSLFMSHNYASISPMVIITQV